MGLELISEVMFSAFLALQLPPKSTYPANLTQDVVKFSVLRKQRLHPFRYFRGNGTKYHRITVWVVRYFDMFRFLFLVPTAQLLLLLPQLYA